MHILWCALSPIGWCSGTIFDNILVTDDVSYARQFAEETWGASKASEKAMYDKYAAEQEKIRKEEADKVWHDVTCCYTSCANHTCGSSH